MYYMYNVQGDVIGIIDADTGNVAATYDYDAWGRCTLIENAEGYTVGTDNPFRYRGYYYDEETGLYYLNSRYYSPEFGRFINADGIIDNRGIITQNLFVYCGNNPANNQDDSGHLFVGAIVGGIVGGLFGGLAALIQGESVKVGIATGAVTGFSMGLICDNVTSLGAVALLVGIASGVGSWLNQVGNNYLENKQVLTHNSSGKLRQDLNSLQENIT